MLVEATIDTIELRRDLVQNGFNDYEIESIFQSIEISMLNPTRLSGD